MYLKSDIYFLMHLNYGQQAMKFIKNVLHSSVNDICVYVNRQWENLPRETQKASSLERFSSLDGGFE